MLPWGGVLDLSNSEETGGTSDEVQTFLSSLADVGFSVSWTMSTFMDSGDDGAGSVCSTGMR